MALLFLSLPALAQEVEIDPYLPLVLQGQWHPLVWEALIPVRTLDPASYLASLPHPLPVEPTVPLPVTVPLPLAHVPSAVAALERGAPRLGPVTVVVPPNVTSVPLPIATFPPPGGKDKGGAVNVIVPPNATNVPLPIATFPPSGGKDKGGAIDVVVPTPAPPLAAPVTVTVTAPPPAAVKPADDADTILLARLNAGDKSKEMLRELAALDLDRLTALLDRLKPYGQEQAADALVKAFLARPEVSLDQRRDWSRNVTLQVAGALGRRQDGRCVEVFEELLASRGEKTREPPWELIGLARFRTQTGQHGEAARAWLRFGDYCTFEQEIANAMVAAARCHMQAHNYWSAVRCCEQARQSDFGWAQGLALLTQSHALIALGKPIEAETCLKTRISGPLAEQIRPLLTLALAERAKAAMRLDEALELYQATVSQLQAVDLPLRGEGLENAVPAAKAGIAEVRNLMSKPLQASPSELVVRLAKHAELGLARTRIIVPRGGGVSVVSVPPLVQVELSTSVGPGPHSYELTATVARSCLDELTRRAEICLAAGNAREHLLTIPVLIIQRAAIWCEPSSAFFGPLLPGSTAVRSVAVKSLRPLRAVEVSHPAVGFDAVVERSREPNTWLVLVRAQAPKAGGVLLGTIQLQVHPDAGTERALALNCAAGSQMPQHTDERSIKETEEARGEEVREP